MNITSKSCNSLAMVQESFVTTSPKKFMVALSLEKAALSKAALIKNRFLLSTHSTLIYKIKLIRKRTGNKYL